MSSSGPELSQSMPAVAKNLPSQDPGDLSSLRTTAMNGALTQPTTTQPASFWSGGCSTAPPSAAGASPPDAEGLVGSSHADRSTPPSHSQLLHSSDGVHSAVVADAAPEPSSVSQDASPPPPSEPASDSTSKHPAPLLPLPVLGLPPVGAAATSGDSRTPSPADAVAGMLPSPAFPSASSISAAMAMLQHYNFSPQLVALPSPVMGTTAVAAGASPAATAVPLRGEKRRRESDSDSSDAPIAGGPLPIPTSAGMFAPMGVMQVLLPGQLAFAPGLAAGGAPPVTTAGASFPPVTTPFFFAAPGMPPATGTAAATAAPLQMAAMMAPMSASMTTAAPRTVSAASSCPSSSASAMHPGGAASSSSSISSSSSSSSSSVSFSASAAKRSRHDCPECRLTFKSESGLAQHQATHHASSREGDDEDMSAADSGDGEGEDELGCDFCSASFPSAAARMAHLRSEHPSQPIYKCSRCPRRYKQQSGLRYHERTFDHDAQPAGQDTAFVHCPQCPKKFRQMSGLQYHQRSAHANAKPFACRHCPHRCVSVSAINAHERTHTRPYLCALCDESFAEPHYWRKHCQRTHGFEPKSSDRPIYRPGDLPPITAANADLVRVDDDEADADADASGLGSVASSPASRKKAAASSSPARRRKAGKTASSRNTSPAAKRGSASASPAKSVSAAAAGFQSSPLKASHSGPPAAAAADSDMDGGGMAMPVKVNRSASYANLMSAVELAYLQEKAEAVGSSTTA